MFKRLAVKLFSTITGGAIIIAFFSVLSKALGLYRDRLLAARFGAGDILDVYYAAFKLPDLVFNTLILGALAAAFIPVFVRYLKQDRDEAFLISNAVLNLLLLVVGFCSLLIIIFAPRIMPWLVPGFDELGMELTARLTRIMFLSVFIFTFSNILSGVLNSFKRFLAFAIAPVLYNLGIVIGILYLFPHPRIGIDGLAWGVVLGSFLHFFVQLLAVYRLGWRYQPLLRWSHQGVKKIIRLMLPRTFALGVNQINQLVIMVIASTLATGSVAIFNLANNLQSLNIIGISLAVSCFPVLSEALADNDQNRFRQIFSFSFRRIMFIVLPLSLLVFLLRSQIVRLILGSGLFDWQATLTTATTLGFFVISLFAQSLIPLLVRSFYSLEDTRTPVFITSFSVVVNIITAISLSRWLGVAGLALAFSLASILNFVLLLFFLKKKIVWLSLKQLGQNTLKVFLAALASVVVAYLVLTFVGQLVNLWTFWGVFSQAAAASLAALFTYLLISYIMGFAELEIVRSYLQKFKIGKNHVD